VIFADGGITQAKAIERALNKYNLDIPVFGMVKDDKHRTKKLIDKEGKEYSNISEDDNIIKFITNLQDEVHNVAIEYNKKLRESNMTNSKLDNIKGIGEKKRIELLKKFGSVQSIKEAKISEITEIKGINEEMARKIQKEL